MEYVTLQNGVNMPILGYGVYQVTQDECERCVLDALEVGYRNAKTLNRNFLKYRLMTPSAYRAANSVQRQSDN